MVLPGDVDRCVDGDLEGSGGGWIQCVMALSVTETRGGFADRDRCWSMMGIVWLSRALSPVDVEVVKVC